MRKIKNTLIAFSALILFSCGNKTENKQAGNQNKQIESQSAKILVTYNQAIKDHKNAVKEVYEMANAMNWSKSTLSKMRPNWQQQGWDTLYVHYDLEKLKLDFKNQFGEDEYNKLSLKIDDNYDKKMNN